MFQLRPHMQQQTSHNTHRCTYVCTYITANMFIMKDNYDKRTRRRRASRRKDYSYMTCIQKKQKKSKLKTNISSYKKNNSSCQSSCINISCICGFDEKVSLMRYIMYKRDFLNSVFFFFSRILVIVATFLM